jgi:hypothetical protein
MRTTRFVGATLVANLVLGLLFVAGAATVAAQEECTLTVEPRRAQAGSEFTLSGAGYTPDTLVLQRDDGEPVTIELDLNDADPFEIPIGSRSGDEGLWTATVSVTDTECSATTRFRVTLRDTAAADHVTTAAGGISPLVYLAVILGGFGIGTLAGRRLRLAF